MCKNIQFLILFDLFVAFVFPNFTVFSQDVVDVEHSEKVEFPHLAAIGYKFTHWNVETIRYACTGSLISSRHVLIPAHCADTRVGKPVHVVLGNKDFVGNESYSQVIDVDSVVTHPLYKEDSNYHNLAMIILKSEANITDHVMPIHLPTVPMNSTILRNQVFSTVVFVGVPTRDGSYLKLKATSLLSIVSQKECNESYSDLKSPKLARGIDNTVICVRDINREKTSGDDCGPSTGGPLIMWKKDAPSCHVLAGITCFWVYCSLSKPDVYTSVYPYLSWINEFRLSKLDSTLD